MPLLAQNEVFTVVKGEASFVSEAPLEVINASSKYLRGAINTKEYTFAFVMPIKTFNGFNNPLQKEHFNEKYLESAQFPSATFTGKIIEKIDFSKPGEYKIRAKGTLSIHGISQERIIRSYIIIDKKRIRLSSSFSVMLADHDISIPKIVNQKIAEEINVEVSAELAPKSPK